MTQALYAHMNNKKIKIKKKKEKKIWIPNKAPGNWVLAFNNIKSGGFPKLGNCKKFKICKG
jgi:hypothetical protein